jgi:hypothetical protein
MAIKDEEVAISGRNSQTSLLDILNKMCYPIFGKISSHPCFGLHAHRNISLTLFNVIMLEILTTENVETWNVVTYNIDAIQYKEPFMLLGNNSVDILHTIFCQNPPSSILSCLCS